MKCKQCGAETATGAAFCHVCGASLTASEPASEPGSTAPPVEENGPRARFQGLMAGNDRGSDAEEFLWTGHFSKLAMLGYWLLAGVLSIVVVIVGAIAPFTAVAWTIAVIVIAAAWVVLALRLVYQQLSVKYSLTTQRLVHEHGLLWRSTDRIEAIDIDDVTVRQGPIERMVGVGTIHIRSSDQSTPEFNIVGIDDVRNVATLIDNTRRQERRKRGLHIETV